MCDDITVGEWTANQLQLNVWLVYLQVEQAKGNILDYLLCNVLRVELGAELELQRRLFLHILTQNLESELNYDLRHVI